MTLRSHSDPRDRADLTGRARRVTPVRVVVKDLMQQGYVYYRTEPVGRRFDPEFRPELTPKQMLRLGVFGGRYMTDCAAEFPADWFARAKLCHQRHDPALNCFGVNASQPLAVWRCKGWIHPDDARRQRQALLHWAYDSRKI